MIEQVEDAATRFEDQINEDTAKLKVTVSTTRSTARRNTDNRHRAITAKLR